MRLLSLVLFFCSACTATARGQHCEVSVPARLGKERATEVARLVDALAPQVAPFLNLPLERTIQVRVSAERFLRGGMHADSDKGTYGLVKGSTVYLGSAALDDSNLLGCVLSHEIGHWLMLDTPWQDTPYLLQEAMVDFIGSLFWPGARQERLRQIEAAGVTGDRAVLELTMDEVHDLPSAERQRVVLEALVIAGQIGFDRLPGLVLEGSPLF